MKKRIAIFGWLGCLLVLSSFIESKKPDNPGNIVVNPVLLQIPVHATFICPNTPGSKIPSHGINKYGVEYAIDFVIVNSNAKSQKPYRPSAFTYVTKGLALSDFYGWGIDIYSPVIGVVAQVVDGVEERNPVKLATDLRYAVKMTRSYQDTLIDAKYLLGNHVIIRTEKLEYIVLAHLQKNSIVVKPGQSVDVTSVIGKLGHSGNSTMPHLHLQAMDNLDFRKAQGIPIVFSHYYLIENGNTIEVRHSIPLRNQIMVFTQ